MRECPTYLPKHGGSVHVYTRLLYSADTRHNGTCLTVDKNKIYHSRGFSNIFSITKRSNSGYSAFGTGQQTDRDTTIL